MLREKAQKVNELEGLIAELISANDEGDADAGDDDRVDEGIQTQD